MDLPGIHLVETRMGRIRGASTAGALEPMQFIPSTLAVYGGGDINDLRDAILAAARLLRANGAPRDMADALWHYNPSDDYVRAVTEYGGPGFNSVVQPHGTGRQCREHVLVQVVSTSQGVGSGATTIEVRVSRVNVGCVMLAILPGG